MSVIVHRQGTKIAQFPLSKDLAQASAAAQRRGLGGEVALYSPSLKIWRGGWGVRFDFWRKHNGFVSTTQ